MVMFTQQRQIAQVINTTGLRGEGGRVCQDPSRSWLWKEKSAPAGVGRGTGTPAVGGRWPGRELRTLGSVGSSHRGRWVPCTPHGFYNQSLPKSCQVCFLNFCLPLSSSTDLSWPSLSLDCILFPKFWFSPLIIIFRFQSSNVQDNSHQTRRNTRCTVQLKWYLFLTLF